jgi:reactive intermediate/imine deaminase
MRHAPVITAILLLAAGTVDAQGLDRLGVPGRTDRPFSESVRVGDVIYLSGQIGTDASGQVVAGGIEGETRQTLENIKAALLRRELGMDRVAKCLVMMADMAEWGRMNAVYVTFFPADALPARSAMGANGLALNARVEIECIAVAAPR